MWFADVASVAAWLVLACWLGWLLWPRLTRGRPPYPAAGQRHRPVVIGASLAVVLNVAQAAVLDSVADDSGVSRIDQPVLGWMVANRSADLTVAAKAVSIAGSPATWTLLSVAVGCWLVARRRWSDAGLLAAAGGGAIALVSVGKAILGRARPPVADHLMIETNQSLPSGHALGSVVVLGALLVLLLPAVGSRLVRAVAVLAASVAVLLVGLSRLYLGVHWSTDVLAGWLLGGAWLATCVTVVTALSARAGPLPDSAGKRMTDF